MLTNVVPLDYYFNKVVEIFANPMTRVSGVIDQIIASEIGLFLFGTSLFITICGVQNFGHFNAMSF